jgi:predicted O-methyltransferase YrrM
MDAVSAACGVEGMIDHSEIPVLVEAGRRATLAIVEIGSYRGQSAVALALGTQAANRVPVYCIDPHADWTSRVAVEYHFTPENRTHFMQNIVRAGVSETVRLINLASDEAWAAWKVRKAAERAIDVLFIDGDHSRVETDVARWGAFLAPGGTLLIHDYRSTQEARDVVAALVDAGQYTLIQIVNELAELRKCA